MSPVFQATWSEKGFASFLFCLVCTVCGAAIPIIDRYPLRIVKKNEYSRVRKEMGCNLTFSKMPFDFNTAVRKQYTTLPVPRDFILSSGTPTSQILWVGCSDSFIIETETLDVLPEEIFVHRNLGNILHNRDLSSESALDWCLNLLKVRLRIQKERREY